MKMDRFPAEDTLPGVINRGKSRFLFRVWAPFCSQVELKLLGVDGATLIGMKKDPEGYFTTEVCGVSSGARYFYVLDGQKDRPDPASRFQPEGVHGPSCVVDPDKYSWKDRNWKGMALRDMVFYEAHVGTFTAGGTFASAAKKIPYLKRLGITCLELMPVAQFPGERNWGYDGVQIYAVQNSYGGPKELKRLIDECHRQGIAVCLDVVYNHLGPEGNYLHDYGPYFTRKYHTPWGDAVNYDDQHSDHVRRFVIENALYWVREFHADALRLDAIHGIYDFGAKHILDELNERVQGLAKELRRPVHVIAESDLNDSRIIRPHKQGGYGLAGQWSDDFHHAVHTVLTGERQGYYEDFGKTEDIVKAVEDGFVYDGTYSPFRKRRHGNSVKDLPKEKLVVCTQNHDQVGNRAFGDRLSALVGWDRQKTAAALLLLSPATPLLFMGQEYGERAPFQYFVDHSDPDLIRAVQEGRKREFAAFGWGDVPDPESKKTFLDSKLTWNFPKGSPGYFLSILYGDLLRLRKRIVLGNRLGLVWRDSQNQWIAFEYVGKKNSRFGVVVSFSEESRQVTLPFGGKGFAPFLHTADKRYGPMLAAHSRKGSGEVFFPTCGAVVGKINR